MKKIYALLLAVICATTVLASCGSDDVSTKEQEKGRPVELTLVTTSLIENEYMYSGTIKAAEEIDVPTLMPGKVVAQNVDIGDKVQAGDVLFEIDQTDIEDNIKALDASVKTARANVKSAETGLNLVNGSAMQTQIENAKAAVSNSELALDNAELALNKAKKDYENNKELYEEGIIAKEVYSQYEDGYNQAKNAYRQAEIAHQQALSTYDITTNKMPAENKQQAEDALEIARTSEQSAITQLENARNKLKDARITSPITGVVSECNIKEGEFLATGAVIPMSIINDRMVHVDVGVSEQAINQIQLEDETSVLVNSVSNEAVQGKVIRIQPAATQDNTYGIKIEIDNEARVLKPGMFAEVYFTSEKSENTIVLPRSVILEEMDEYYVFVEEDGIAKKIHIEIGIENEDKIEVVNGLSENMKVVSKGQNYIQDGDQLLITSDGKEE